MASNVNMKFVAILTGVIIVLSVVVGAAFVSTKLKSADELETLGDKAMEAGAYDDARLYYSKAVNKEQNNLGRLNKWLDAIERWQPETETEYESAFNRTFMVAHRGIAEADRLNPETQDAFLNMMRERSLLWYSREGANNMIQLTTDAIEPFENNPSAPEGWERIRRYRGFAIERIISEDGVVEPEQRQLALEDLEAAIAADPTDGEALLSIMKIMTNEADRLYLADRPEEADDAYAAALARMDEFIRVTPDEPWSTVFRPLLEFTRETKRRSYGLLSDESRRVVRELLPTFREPFERAISLLESHEGDVTEKLLSPAVQLEQAIDPTGGYRRSRALLDRAIQAQPEKTELVLFAARLAEQSGDNEEALEWFEAAAELPDLPMSLDGYMRFSMRRIAIISQADLLIRQALENTELTEAERSEKLTRAKELRDEYASRVTSEDPRLLFIDGLHNVANDNLAEALRQFQRYNELTVSTDQRGLWREGQTASRLGQHGIAEAAYEKLTAINPNNSVALYALGEVKLSLQKNAEAQRLFQKAAEISPDNEGFRERAAIAEAIENPDLAEDPVIGTILRSRRTRLGDAETPGDPVAARRMLEQGLIDHNQHPLIVRELVVALLQVDNLTQARAVARAGAAANPDDTTLPVLVRGLEQDSVTDVRLWLIEQADVSDVEREMEKFRLFSSVDDQDRALAALAAAEAADPDNPNVLESRFSLMLTEGDFEGAARQVERATAIDADTMGGLSFRARLLAAQGDYEQAVQVMQDAVDRGAVPIPAYRLLALHQRSAGRPAAAAVTLERALEVAPNNILTINDYLSTLVTLGRMDDALDAARRSERYGRGNADFRNLWLNLEAAAGGDAGRSLAIQRRERILETEPDDLSNRARLAGLYMDERRWADAKTIIDGIRAEEDSLGAVSLLARWYADQGRVVVDGTVRSGMDMARSTYTNYIVRIPESEMTVTPWMAMATFLIEQGDLPNAMLALEEASALQSEDREVDKLLGDLMLERGRFAQARDAYQQVIDAGADDTRQTYLQRLIETHLRLGSYKPALAAMDELVEPAASSQTTTLQRAEALMGDGDEAAAMDLLTRAVNQNPDQPLPYTLRARAVLAQGGLVSDALADLDNALRIDPNSTRARRMRAGVYFREGRTEDALRDLREVVRQDPSLSDVAFALVQEYLSANRERDALSVVDEVMRKRPQDMRTTLGFAAIFAGRDSWSRASQLYESAWTRSKSPTAGARLIDSLLRQNRPALVTRARNILGEIEAVVPDSDTNSGLLALEASIEEAAGNSQRAVELMGNAFELAGGDPREVFSWSTNFGQIYRERTLPERVRVMRSIRAQISEAESQRWLDLLIGRQLVADDATRAEGIAILSGLRDSRQDDAVALVAFQTEGAAHYGNDDYANARRVWSDGLRQFPRDAEMSNNMAFMLVDKLDDAEGALDYALTAVETGGGRAAMQDTLAAVYIAMGRFDEARQALDAAEQSAQTNKDRLDIMISRAKLAIRQGDDARARTLLNDALELTVPLGAEREGYQTEIEELLAEIGSAD